jgi:glycosidase
MTNPPPNCTLPSGGYPLGSANEQIEDEGSVYNYYREAIAIRNALPMIARGKNTCETALNQGCVSAVRKSWNNQDCIILMNINDDEAGIQVDLSAYSDWTLVASLAVGEQLVTLDGTTLTMPAYGTAILVPAK